MTIAEKAKDFRHNEEYAELLEYHTIPTDNERLLASSFLLSQTLVLTTLLNMDRRHLIISNSIWQSMAFLEHI